MTLEYKARNAKTRYPFGSSLIGHLNEKHSCPPGKYHF